MNKICPLLFASSVQEIEFECRPDRCALAYDGNCAVTVIAACLDYITDDSTNNIQEAAESLSSIAASLDTLANKKRE